MKPGSLVPRLVEKQVGLDGGEVPLREATDFQDVQPGDTVGVVAEELQKTDDGDDFIERYYLQRGTPCAKCSCELQRSLSGELVCCRCFPARDYHLYGNQVDVLYPRRRRLEL